MDELSFFEPVNLGDLVTVTASVNGVGDTSMEVGVKVETENVMTGERRHTSTAYLLYVAVDAVTKQPVPVPDLVCETPEERRRQRQAKARRKARTARREASLAARAANDDAARRRQEAAEARRQARLAAEAAEPAEEPVAAEEPAAEEVETPEPMTATTAEEPVAAEETAEETAAAAEPAASEAGGEVRKWRRREKEPEPALVGAGDSTTPATDLTKWRRHSR
jgi:hypothetical protein